MRTVTIFCDADHSSRACPRFRFVELNQIVMKDSIQRVSTLQQLLDYDTGKFTSAEIQLLRTLPRWMQLSNSLKLDAVLQKYQSYVQQHIEKLEGFIKEEGINALRLNNRVMQALVDETEEKLRDCADPEVRDACLLAAIQTINHYKISIYGTAAAFAHALGMDAYSALFREAEVNEKQIDDRLSQLAEHEINPRAKTPVVSLG